MADSTHPFSFVCLILLAISNYNNKKLSTLFRFFHFQKYDPVIPFGNNFHGSIRKNNRKIRLFNFSVFIYNNNRIF